MDSPLLLQASSSQTPRPIMPTLIENSWPLYMVVRNSTHTCYGRTFIMEMDHKPLKMISLRNLTAAPACLQRMLLCLQQYDLVIMYWPGREMLLADALSCLPSRTNTEIKLDLQVDAISMFAFTLRCLTKISAETQWDPILSMVHRLTLNSWPDRQGCVPRAARFYWSFCDKLFINGDILTKGK